MHPKDELMNLNNRLTGVAIKKLKEDKKRDCDGNLNTKEDFYLMLPQLTMNTL